MLTYEAPLTGSPDQGHIVVHQLVHKYSLSRQIFPFGSMALDILCMGLTKFHKDGPQISVCFESTLPNICKSVALHTKDEFVKASTLGIPCLFLAIDYRVSLECTIGNDYLCMVDRALQSQFETRVRIQYPDLGQNLGPRLKFRTFEIRIQFHYSELNLGLGLNFLS